MKAIYLSMGTNDLVAIIELPSDQAAAWDARPWESDRGGRKPPPQPRIGPTEQSCQPDRIGQFCNREPEGKARATHNSVGQSRQAGTPIHVSGPEKSG